MIATVVPTTSRRVTGVGQLASCVHTSTLGGGAVARHQPKSVPRSTKAAVNTAGRPMCGNDDLPDALGHVNNCRAQRC